MKYFAGEKFGIEREYYESGGLKYEIEHLKGERKGIGKEYNNNGNVIFEGEYLYGKRWNGKGYDLDNNIVYSLKDGKGIVKEYNDNGSVLFEVEYLNGERNGKGKEYDERKLKYEGEYLNGKIWNGKGYDKNGNKSYEIKDRKWIYKRV